jgi:hypothetical protein
MSVMRQRPITALSAFFISLDLRILLSRDIDGRIEVHPTIEALPSSSEANSLARTFLDVICILLWVGREPMPSGG